MDEKKILIYFLFLSLFTGCSEIIPLVHEPSQEGAAYPNLGSIKVNLFENSNPSSQNFSPAVDTFFLSTIQTKIEQSHLFTLSDSAQYELSGKIDRFQSTSRMSTGRAILGSLALTAYFGGSIFAIAKSDATYFYVGLGVTPFLIGSALLFDMYHETSVEFEFSVKKNGKEVFRDTISSESTTNNSKYSKALLLDRTLNNGIDEMLKCISENVK